MYTQQEGDEEECQHPITVKDGSQIVCTECGFVLKSVSLSFVASRIEEQEHWTREKRLERHQHKRWEEQNKSRNEAAALVKQSCSRLCVAARECSVVWNTLGWIVNNKWNARRSLRVAAAAITVALLYSLKRADFTVDDVAAVYSVRKTSIMEYVERKKKQIYYYIAVELSTNSHQGASVSTIRHTSVMDVLTSGPQRVPISEYVGADVFEHVNMKCTQFVKVADETDGVSCGLNPFAFACAVFLFFLQHSIETIMTLEMVSTLAKHFRCSLMAVRRATKKIHCYITDVIQTVGLADHKHARAFVTENLQCVLCMYVYKSCAFEAVQFLNTAEQSIEPPDVPLAVSDGTTIFLGLQQQLQRRMQGSSSEPSKSHVDGLEQMTNLETPISPRITHVEHAATPSVTIHPSSVHGHIIRRHRSNEIRLSQCTPEARLSRQTVDDSDMMPRLKKKPTEGLPSRRAIDRTARHPIASANCTTAIFREQIRSAFTGFVKKRETYRGLLISNPHLLTGGSQPTEPIARPAKSRKRSQCSSSHRSRTGKKLRVDLEPEVKLGHSEEVEDEVNDYNSEVSSLDEADARSFLHLPETIIELQRHRQPLATDAATVDSPSTMNAIA